MPSDSVGPVPEFSRVFSLFDRAMAVPAGDREAFVERAAAGDAVLVARVLALLRAGEVAKTVELRDATAPAAGGDAVFDRMRALLERALDVPAPEREAFVRREAAADPVLRGRAIDLSATILAVLQSGAATPADGAPGRGTPGERVRSTATSELFARLEQAPRLDPNRYELHGELDRGGMGAILSIHDLHLNRRLAMKVLLEREPPRDDYEQQLAHQLLGRFLEEAQVTSQLDHPGVVPVHELGLDPTGRVYFTMRLVKGRTAHDVFAESHAGSAEWPLTRALEVVLKVCDTMAFAHDKGVLHRDLKPANVMVGRFGEVYVMDWGLAKVLGQPERRDVRIRPQRISTVSQVDSARKRDADSDDLASVVSLDGQKIGTPCYMPPEQARSEPLDVRADVYAIGAMLYELLTGRAPYTSPGIAVDAYRILKEVNDGPPKRIEELQRGVPAELVAIADKAMARDREERYRGTLELAADLRAFLAHRAVRAYRTGALVELKLWVRRNKPLAASLAAAVLILVGGIVATTVYAREADRQAEANATLARDKAELAAAETAAKEAAQAEREQAQRQSYVAQLVAAEAALRSGETGTAKQRLAAAPEAYRGWEWRHLTASADQSVVTLQGDSLDAASEDGQRLVIDGRLLDAEGKLVAELFAPAKQVFATFSEDGRRVAAALSDANGAPRSMVHVRTWDATTGGLLHEVRLREEQSPLELPTYQRLVRVDFTGDLQRVVTQYSPPGKPWLACVWDAASGELLTHVAYVKGRAAVAVPRANRLCIATDAGARVLDATSCQLLWQCPPLAADDLFQLVLSPDGRMVAVAQGNQVQVYEVGADAPRFVLSGHDPEARKVVFSRDGSTLATAAADNIVRVWDASTGTLRARLRGPPPLSIEGYRVLYPEVAVSPDGGSVAAVFYNANENAENVVFVYDVGSGTLLAALRGHEQVIRRRRVRFCGASHIVTGSDDRTVRLWSVPRQIVAVNGFSSAEDASFDPAGRQIVVPDGTEARVIDLGSGEVGTVLRGHHEAVSIALFSPDGRSIATAAEDRTVRVWDAASGEQQAVLPVEWSLIAFCPDNERIAVAGPDVRDGDRSRGATVWSVATGQRVAALDHDDACCVCWSPDGGRLLTLGRDGSGRVFSGRTFEVLAELRGHGGGGDLVGAFRADGRQIATASHDGTVRLWDASDGRQLRCFRPVPAEARYAPEFGVQYVGEGRRLLVMRRPFDGEPMVRWHTSAQVVDASTGVHTALGGPLMRVGGCAVSPDGRRIATCDTFSARLWDAATGAQLLVLRDRLELHSIRFTPDGRRLVAIGLDGEILVWDAATAAERHQERLEEERARPAAIRLLTAVLRTATSLLQVSGRLRDSREDPVVVRVAERLLGRQADLVRWLHEARVFRAEVLAVLPAAQSAADDLAELTRLLAVMLPADDPDWLVERAWRIAMADEDDVVFPSELGRWILRRAALATAERAARTALALQPGHRLAREVLGAIQFHAGRFEDALGTLQDVGEDPSRLPIGPVFLAATRKALGRLTDPDETLVRLGELLEADWPYPDQVYLREVSGASPDALNQVAWRLVVRPGPDSAKLQLALRAARIAEQSAFFPTGDIKNTLGVVQYRLGSFGEAIDTLRDSDRLNHSSSVADAAFLAMALKRTGDDSGAEEAFARLQVLMADRNDADAQAIWAEARSVLGK